LLVDVRGQRGRTVVLLLEDDAGRVKRFRAVLRAMGRDDVMVWQSARVMMREAAALLSRATVISLDHDLEQGDAGEDVGDGLDVARWLADQRVTCAVIVHTSNGERGRVMMGEFELAGIECSRVSPFGEEWVEREWAGEVKRLAEARA
jgi:DNA-binding NarL/FixJ family response regulator